MNLFPLSSKTRAFSLVEIMVALAIGMVVMAAVAQIFVLTFKTIHKNQVLDKALTTTRLVQEHFNRELSSAISQIETPPIIRPELGVSPNATTSTVTDPVTGNNTYSSMLTYRIGIGSVATMKNGAGQAQNVVVISCLPDMSPIEVGDFLMIGSPNAGKLLQINQIDGSIGPNGGDLTLHLTETIAAAELQAGTVPADVAVNTVVTIQRERRYSVVAGSDNLYELRWQENTWNSAYVVLSSNIASTTRDAFTRMPEETGTPVAESSIKWRLGFAYGDNSLETASSKIAGGNTAYYSTNYVQGMIMPKSGNPISSSSYAANTSAANSGAYSTTLVTTTNGTSTTLQTTTSGTSTTLQTTTAGTSTTLQSTSTAGTSTTLKSTTLKTTLVTSTAGTTTKGTSTTLKSTTLKTTLVTSTAGTTTKGTSTTLKTTTQGTSTTLQSTTLQTSTAGTSTTLQSTTSAGTSTTLKTTTSGTSTTLKTTTTVVTTTISYDG